MLYISSYLANTKLFNCPSFGIRLTLDKQIDAVCLNVSRRITLLKLLSKYVDQKNLTQYYNCYILPIYDYGCLIWGRCSAFNTNRLVKEQKRGARIILNVDLMTASEQMFSESSPKTVKYHTCVMMYDIFNDMARESNFSVSEMHGRSLRSVDKELLNIGARQ